MLNCALGTVIAPIFAIVVVVKKSAILSVIPAIKPLFDIEGVLPVLVAALLALILSMNSITTPSISLEGKNLWVLKSLPVSPADVFKAKINLHLILTLPFIVISAAAIGVTLSLKAEDILSVCILLYVLTVFEAALGLIINIKRPNFNWTNETTPIKQSLNALIYMLVAWIVPIIIAGGYLLAKILLPITVTATNYILALVFIFAALTYLLNSWIYKKGVKLFEEF